MPSRIQTADIGGFDAARKIAILSSIAFNTGSIWMKSK